MRPNYDITHTLNGNWVWEIPVGEGRRWMDNDSVLSAVAGGWDLSGFLRIRSGETINIVSGRGTINRGGSRGLTNTVHLTGIDIQELQRRTGAFRNPDGRVTLFAPSLITEGGGGQSRYFCRTRQCWRRAPWPCRPSADPGTRSLDLGLRKSIALPLPREVRLQLRIDFFNVLNRTNFNVGSVSGIGGLGVSNRHDPNSTQFGLISSAFSARETQVGHEDHLLMNLPASDASRSCRTLQMAA